MQWPSCLPASKCSLLGERREKLQNNYKRKKVAGEFFLQFVCSSSNNTGVQQSFTNFLLKSDLRGIQPPVGERLAAISAYRDD